MCIRDRLYSDIPRITISVFPSSERCLYKKRKCLKGGKSVTAPSALTVIMYVPSSEARKPSPSSTVLYSDIPRIIISVFPSSERCLYKKMCFFIPYTPSNRCYFSFFQNFLIFFKKVLDFFMPVLYNRYLRFLKG